MIYYEGNCPNCLMKWQGEAKATFKDREGAWPDVFQKECPLPFCEGMIVYQKVA